jgi:carbon-monoxide dehydrogenase medium subunit
LNPAPFTYHKPESLQAAIALLQEHAEDGKLLAGGHSLLPVMKLRLAQPGHLIDISGLRELTGVRQVGETLQIGALTVHRDIERDELLARSCPLLPEVAHVVGDQQVRNRGTIGGALAHADPAADFPAAILALDAQLVARGPDGERAIAAADFFLGFLTTALDPLEVLTEIRVSVASPGEGSNYQKLANQASGYAIVGVAARVRLAENGECAAAWIGITGASDHAVRATSVEEAITGKQLDATTIRAAASLVVDGLDLLDDLHASSSYRAGIVRGLTQRALTTAMERASASRG